MDDSTEKQVNVLSIDAWHAGCDGCMCETHEDEDAAHAANDSGDHFDSWTWNAWYKVQTLPLAVCDLKPAEVIEALISEGLLNDCARTECDVEDDGYNVVILKKSNRKPLFALAYGDVDTE